MPIALPIRNAPADCIPMPSFQASVLGPEGPVAVPGLRVGSPLVTRSGSRARVIWLGRRRLTAARLAAAPRLAPILIRRNALGEDTPSRDLLLSPEHRIRFCDPRARAWFGRSDIWVAAVQLTFIPGVEQLGDCEVLYFHPILAEGDGIRLNGCWIEAARAADATMADPANPQRQELLQLYPELVTLRGWLPDTASAAAATSLR